MAKSRAYVSLCHEFHPFTRKHYFLSTYEWASNKKVNEADDWTNQ